MKVKKIKKKSILLRVAILVFLAYGLFSFVSLRMTLAQKDRQLDEINQKIASQKQANEELKTMLSAENYDEYVIRIAREKLGYIYSDERVFVDVSGS